MALWLKAFELSPEEWGLDPAPMSDYTQMKSPASSDPTPFSGPYQHLYMQYLCIKRHAHTHESFLKKNLSKTNMNTFCIICFFVCFLFS